MSDAISLKAAAFRARFSDYLPRYPYALVPAAGYDGEQGTDYISGIGPNVADGKACVLLFELRSHADAAALHFTAESKQEAKVTFLDMMTFGDSDETVMVTLYRQSSEVATLSAAYYRSRIDPESTEGLDECY